MSKTVNLNCLVNCKQGKEKKGSSSQKKKNKRLTILFIAGLLLFPIAQWAIFWLYPNIRTFILPFMEYSRLEGKLVFPNSHGLFYNFKTQIESFVAIQMNGEHSLIYNAFFNTFNSLWINLIILPIAIIIGFALSKHVPGEKFFRVIFFLPNILSTVIMCLVFRAMFENNTARFIGPASKLLEFLHIPYEGWSPENARSSWILIYIFCIWAGLSTNVVLISSAFQRIPKEIIESAKLDGISFFGELFQIGVPLIMPTVSTFLVNSVICVTNFYLQPYLLLSSWGSNGKIATIPWLIFDYTEHADSEKTYIVIATIGIMFSIIMFPLIMLARFIGKKLTPDVEF